MTDTPAAEAAKNALYQMQKTFVHLPAGRIDQARRQLAEVERAVEASVRERVAREIEKSEFQRGPISGSNHYIGGYTDGLADAALTARNGAPG